MNKVKILFPISILTLLLTIDSIGAIEKFEKGDILFRAPWAPGHAALYWRWVDKTLSPDTLESHILIESVPDHGVHIENLKNFYVPKMTFKGAKTVSSISYVQRKKIIQSARRELGDGFVSEPPSAWETDPRTWTWGDKGPNTWSCVGLTEYCYECAGFDPVPNDRWPWYVKETHLWYWNLFPKTQYNSDKLVFSSGIFYYLTFHKSGIIEVGEAITPKIKYEDSKYYIKDKVSIKFYASDGSVGSGLGRAELWLGEPDDTPDALPGERICKNDAEYTVDNTYTTSFNTTTVDNGEYTLYAKAFDQAGNYATTSIPVVIENVAAIEKLFSWQGYDLRLTFSRDTQGPTYTIYYKEKAEDSWKKWGEYETKDTGQYTGDIILNLNLEEKIREFESEADDAGRLTHECKLTATGKDVFKEEEAYGYKTERLIVDTTADWNAGVKDGITVVDEVHPEGGQKKGYIKPYFGYKHPMKAASIHYISYAAGYAWGSYTWWRKERIFYNCPDHGYWNCPGFSDYFSDAHNEALRDWVMIYDVWVGSRIGGGWLNVWNFGNYCDNDYGDLFVMVSRSLGEKGMWKYMPLGDPNNPNKFAGGTYSWYVASVSGSPFSVTVSLSDFSVALSSDGSGKSGNVPSTLQGEVVGDEVRFYMNYTPDFDVWHPSWSLMGGASPPLERGRAMRREFYCLLHHHR